MYIKGSSKKLSIYRRSNVVNLKKSLLLFSFGCGIHCYFTKFRKQCIAKADIEISKENSFPFVEKNAEFWVMYYYKHKNELFLIPFAFDVLQESGYFFNQQNKEKMIGFLSHIFSKYPSHLVDISNQLFDVLRETNHDIVYTALSASRTSLGKDLVNNYINDCQNENGKHFIKGCLENGLNLTSLENIDVYNIKSKVNIIEGYYYASGDNVYMFNATTMASNMWDEENLIKTGDLNYFYCGMVLTNKLLELMAAHNELRNFLNEEAMNTELNTKIRTFIGRMLNDLKEMEKQVL